MNRSALANMRRGNMTLRSVHEQGVVQAQAGLRGRSTPLLRPIKQLTWFDGRSLRTSRRFGCSF